jgi:hypothetical protein
MNTAATHPDGSGWYEIRLQGRLDRRWSARFDGTALSTGDGQTQLAGPVVDQAALHGLLHQLGDAGLPLLSVSRVEPGAASRPTTATDTTPDTTHDTTHDTTGEPT